MSASDFPIASALTSTCVPARIFITNGMVNGASREVRTVSTSARLCRPPAISAKSGEGIPELLDTMVLISEMEEYRGDISLAGEGFVLESKMDSKKGVITTAIIKNGTLRQGDFIVINNQIIQVEK